MHQQKGNQLRNIKLCALIALCFTVFQAKAETSSGTGSISGAINELLSGGQLESSMQKNQQQNTAVVNSVTPDVVSDTQSKLPKFNDFLGKLRYGTHNTVSSNGEQVVALIRSLATDPAQKDKALRQLQSLAKANNPEALNFIGFVLANGLFGATKNHDRAVEYFNASAAAGYQPAIYNLAIEAAYSGQGKESIARATNYINRASDIAKDSSSRVCGFASFLYYRQGDMRKAVRYTHECGSALVGLPVAISTTTLPLTKRIDLLRTSIATGVNDAYPLLERFTRESADNDNQYLYCKYNLLNRMRLQPQLNINDLAARCYDQFTHVDSKDKADANRRSQSIRGITSFAFSEKLALEQLRSSNHFHYAWSVPYLPFQQQDVDLFTPMFPRTPQ
jgi:TPR repeat protein